MRSFEVKKLFPEIIIIIIIIFRQTVKKASTYLNDQISWRKGKKETDMYHGFPFTRPLHYDA